MTTSVLKKPKDNWELLGLTRFLLALIVFVTHLGEGPQRGPWYGRLYLLGAFSAVLGFLILSGYSIGHSFERNPKGYYRRRLLRIYPLYALALIFTVVIGALGHHEQPAKLLKVCIGNLLFLQTYKFVPMLCNPVVWTLAVEATCYLFAPLFARLNTPMLLGISALSAIAYACYPKLGLPYYAWCLSGRALLFLLWAWMAGFIYQRERGRAMSSFWLVVAMFGMASVNHVCDEPCSNWTLISVCVALIAGGSLAIPSIVKRVWSFLGDYSYPLYLFHAPAYYLSSTLHLHKTWQFAAAGMAVALVAWWLDRATRPALDRWSVRVADRLETAVSAGRTAVVAAVDHWGGAVTRTILHAMAGRAKVLLRAQSNEAAAFSHSR